MVTAGRGIPHWFVTNPTTPTFIVLGSSPNPAAAGATVVITATVNDLAVNAHWNCGFLVQWQVDWYQHAH